MCCLLCPDYTDLSIIKYHKKGIHIHIHLSIYIQYRKRGLGFKILPFCCFIIIVVFIGISSAPTPPQYMARNESWKGVLPWLILLLIVIIIIIIIVAAHVMAERLGWLRCLYSSWVKGSGSVSWRDDPEGTVHSATEVCSHGRCILPFALFILIWALMKPWLFIRTSLSFSGKSLNRTFQMTCLCLTTRLNHILLDSTYFVYDQDLSF